jgi:hypothetical protein
MRTKDRRRTTIQTFGWARLWSIARAPLLRTGVWYRVVGNGASNKVVLDVPGGQIAVPRHLVEVRDERPPHFTVVYRSTAARNPVQGTERDLGRTYAVCPNSGARIRLEGHPDSVQCPQCGHAGLVAWWETG